MGDGDVKIGLIIAAWKAAPFLDGCLGTLEKIDRQGLDLKVFLIDDCSPDKDVELVRRRWPWVEAVRLDKNRGFAGANNAGMKLALDWGADYVYLLNQDTEVDPRFLVEAVRTAGERPDVGAVQSLLLLHPDRHLVNSWGNVIHFLGFGYSLGYRRPRTEVGDDIREIVYASGAAVLLRVEALRRVGLFDESLYMYHEDLDLGWRLRLNGWRIVLAPRAVVFHKYEFARSITKFFWMERNRYLVMFHNLRAWSLAVLFPWMLLSELALFVLAVKGGWWREKLKVYRFLLTPSNWEEIGSRRRVVAGIRKVSDRVAVRNFVSAISFQDFTGPFVEKVANPLMGLTWAIIRRLII